jgi:hypothetical protein
VHYAKTRPPLVSAIEVSRIGEAPNHGAAIENARRTSAHGVKKKEAMRFTIGPSKQENANNRP